MNKMGEKLRQNVQIPVWAVTLIFTILIAFSSFSINVSVKAGQMKEQVETTRIQIDKKVDKDQYKIDVDRIYRILERIENKVDREK